MGQSLDSMSGQNPPSKEEVLYQMVLAGNVEAIKALCREGSRLEWVDKDGKTPLIVACMNSALFNVARVLIELGANVNAYRPGRHGGTPLHHASKRGLEQTVNLLLCSGANALVRNDDCQTSLDVARIKGHIHVVRAIENHICYFCGWLREFYGPGFLEALAPQFLSRKIWVVVIPCSSSNQLNSQRLQLVIYSTLQEIQPRTIIALWKAKIEEPKFDQSDPGLIIYDQSTRNRYKFASGNMGDKQQLHWLYDACRGTPQVMPQPPHHVTPNPSEESGHQTSAEAIELAMAISNSIQSATENGPPVPTSQQSSEEINANGWENSVHLDSHNGWGLASGSTQSAATSGGWMHEAGNEDYSGWGMSNTPIGNQGHVQTPNIPQPVAQTTGEMNATVPFPPSAPPIPFEASDEGPISYPSIDFSPVDLSVPAVENGASVASDSKDGSGSSSCIICWEAPVEGACIPCGHMAGCMECLNAIKSKKGDCPVCRAKINQVIRLYAV